jgi:hypothetical protein
LACSATVLHEVHHELRLAGSQRARASVPAIVVDLLSLGGWHGTQVPMV